MENKKAPEPLLNKTRKNWSMVPDVKKLVGMFEPGKAKQMDAGFNKHKRISRSQYGGTAAIAFSRLVGCVIKSKTDSTGLGQGSWLLVGSGKHRTCIIILAYQPVKPSLGAKGSV